MRTIKQCLKVSVSELTDKEVQMVVEWLDTEARYTHDSYDYCCLLGWFVLDDPCIPLSPKEAGFD